ncbi:MAG TPA: sporulation protein YunB [Candidatus Atribacteria bacterium]|nr:sporulation protein YunB [Candidatus Atribacteria bacterium]HPT79410.1 sporulation protein YunB [Candidatus Atribacteria bacterium]
MKQVKIGRKLLIITLIVIGASIVVFVLIDIGIKPTIIAMSEAKVEYIAILAMNNAVNKILGSDIKYTDLTDVLLDKDGKISMIQYNTILINRLARETSTLAQDEIRSLGEEGVTVPLGSITRSKILSGLGPNIKVRIIPVGAVSTDFTDEFQQAGINQTRHKIYLQLRTQVRIVVPLGSETINVSTRVPISESIVVGDVPNTYVNVANEDQMLNLIPIE